MAKILVLDDSPDILQAIKYIFEMEGHESIMVTNKKELLAQLLITQPDRIIIDVMLKGEDGRKICKELRSNEETKRIPIILMSASPQALARYEVCQATDIIHKPFHVKDFTFKVNTVLKLLP